MTDYSSMSHQQLYDYVLSGSPSSVDAEATLNQQHGKSVTEATSDLKKTLTSIQASWSGAAADEFSQQANAIVSQMQAHAQTADNTYTWMNYASKSLVWAQQNMPSPPSGAEQDLADINTNTISEWGIGLLTDGTSVLASKAAEQDIAKKKALAVSVMTQLASAYTTAKGQLTIPEGDDGGGTDVDPPASSGSKKSGQDGSGSSTSGASGSSTNPGGMIMPMAMAIPHNGTTGGDSGGTSLTSTGTAHSVTTGSSGSGTGTTGSGTTTGSKPTTTVTAGLGDVPPGTTPGGTGATTTGGGYSGSGSNLGGLGPGGLAEFGGSGAAGLGSGMSSGVIGADDEGSFGSTGLATGSGTSSGLSGGTGTGEIGDEAAGTGSGLLDGSDASTAGAATGAADGTGATSQNAMMGGGMGGMGGHGMGGQEERGNRASWLKEDPDYWYGDKMKNAAPPGGVIE